MFVLIIVSNFIISTRVILSFSADWGDAFVGMSLFKINFEAFFILLLNFKKLAILSFPPTP